jgi:radical SAM protein with 4Fe4S-binding SPASM domain
VFDPQRGTTLEVDKEAMDLLLTIGERGVVREDDIPDDSETKLSPRSRNQCVRVIDQLLALGILVPPSPSDLARYDSDASADAVEKLQSLTGPWFAGPGISAPETVHWAITYRCERRCADCYVRRHDWQFPGEMNTHDALRVVDALAEWGVFQLALGGGEPLERPDLAMIAKHAHGRGLVVHVTTGRREVSYDVLAGLAPGVTVLQFGIRHEALLENASAETASLRRSVKAARSLGLRVGANLMLSNTVLANFARLIAILTQAGMKSITLLRYKPTAEPARWRREHPSREAMGGLEQLLPEVTERHPEIVFRIDCAASFLQRRLPPAVARSAGIRGCTAANRILALAPDGSMFPCSQLIHPDLRAGNILTDDPGAIWTDSAIMRKYRFFREGGNFRGSECGACAARSYCSGCRVFARDAWGAEPECPVEKKTKAD